MFYFIAFTQHVLSKNTYDVHFTRNFVSNNDTYVKNSSAFETYLKKRRLIDSQNILQFDCLLGSGLVKSNFRHIDMNIYVCASHLI